MKLKMIVLASSVFVLAACGEEEKRACSQVEVKNYNVMASSCEDIDSVESINFTTASMTPEIRVSSNKAIISKKSICAAATDKYISESSSDSCRVKKAGTSKTFTTSSSALVKRSAQLKIEVFALEQDNSKIMTQKTGPAQQETVVSPEAVQSDIADSLEALAGKTSVDALYGSAEERYNALPGDEVGYGFRRSNTEAVYGGSYAEKSSSDFRCVKSGLTGPETIYSYVCYKKISDASGSSQEIYSLVEGYEKNKNTFMDDDTYIDYGTNNVNGLKTYERNAGHLNCLKGVTPSATNYRCYSRVKYETDSVFEPVEIIVEEGSSGIVIPEVPFGAAPESPVMR